jgi:hypothetical protein
VDDDEWWQSLWHSAGDREKILALLIFAAFFLSIPACALAFGASLADPGILPLGLVGLVILLWAVYILVKPRSQTDPHRRARQAEIRRQRQEGLLVGQPELARELGVKSPTVRRWCQKLGLEPACKLGRNYYTLAQADLIRRYGSAGTSERREILEGLKDRPFEDRASDCTACGAWNPPGSQHCGECGAVLEGAEA